MIRRLERHAPRAIAAGALVLLVGGAAAMAIGAIRDDQTAAAAIDPAAAVRQFLVDGVLDGNGLQACRYLTDAERGRVARRAGSPLYCPAAFDSARLGLGGQDFTTEWQVFHDLTATTHRDRDGALVRLSHGGESRELSLVRATEHERAEFSAPETPWRIARGATAFVPRLKQ